MYMRSTKLPDSTYLEQHTAHIEVCVWVITGTLLNQGLQGMYSVSNPTTVSEMGQRFTLAFGRSSSAYLIAA